MVLQLEVRCKLKQILILLFTALAVLSIVPEPVQADWSTYWRSNPVGGGYILINEIDRRTLSGNTTYLCIVNGNWGYYTTDNYGKVRVGRDTYTYPDAAYAVNSSTSGVNYSPMLSQGWEVVHGLVTLDHRWVGAWGIPRWELWKVSDRSRPTNPYSFSAPNNGFVFAYGDDRWSCSYGNVGAYNPDWYDHYVIVHSGTGYIAAPNTSNLTPFTTLMIPAGGDVSRIITRRDIPIPVTVLRKDARKAAAVETKSVQTISGNTARLTGNISNLGLPSATQAGVLWSTNPTETLLRKGSASAAGVAVSAAGQYQADFTGLQPGITYYVRAYVDNGYAVGYSAIQSFKLNLPVNIVKSSPGEVLFHKGEPITFRYSTTDPEDKTISQNMVITDAGSGAVLYNAPPKVINTESVAEHVLTTEGLNLEWSDADSRYQKRLKVVLQSTDDESTAENASIVTVYNLKPNLDLSQNGNRLNINSGEPLEIKGYVWDSNRENLTVSATVNGSLQVAVVTGSPTSKPGSENFTLRWDNLPNGEYGNIDVQVTDSLGGANLVKWVSTARISDVLVMIRDAIMGKTAPKSTDLNYHVGNTGVTINPNSANNSKADKIVELSDNRSATPLMTGKTDATKPFLAPKFEAFIDNTPDRNEALMTKVGADAKSFIHDNPAVFVISDVIDWNMAMKDIENDYMGIGAAEKLLPYESQPENVRVPKPGSIKVRYTHNPGIFDNPDPVHSLSGSFLNVGSFADAKVIKQAQLGMRGEWIIEAACADNTDTPFDKDSEPANATIIIHNPPKAAVDVNEDESKFYLDGGPSYDIDYQYSKPDNGIKRYEWFVMTEDGAWSKLANESKEVTVPKTQGGQEILKYSLTVTDWHGAKDSLVKDVDFSFLANLSVDKPYPQILKTNDGFRATYRITTDETINSVTCWIPPWGSVRNMTFLNRVGSVSTYHADYVVPGGIPDMTYKVYGNVKTVEGHDVIRFCRIRVLNNRPPLHDSVAVTPANAYTGDTLATAIQFHDPDYDVLNHRIVLKRAGATVYDQTHSVAPSGSSYPTQNITLLPNAPDGEYVLTSTITDPFGASDTRTESFTVHRFVFTGEMLPADPMAGDKLIYRVHTEGGVERFQLSLDPSVITNDRRVEMGYPAASYPVTWSANGAVSVKDSELEYILWCTTPQSITLKGVRSREAYTFTLRAYIGDVYRDLVFVRDVSGDVRQLIKTQ